MTDTELDRVMTRAETDATRARPQRLLADAQAAPHRLAASVPLKRKLVVELVGTFFLVFTVGMATAKTGAGALAPLAIGSALTVMVFAGAHVSGAHYNPAVSVAVLLRRKIAASDAVAYVATQLVAAFLAGLLVRSLTGAEALAPVASTWKVLAVEFLFTFALAYVVLNVATIGATEGNSFYGVAIGLTVTTGAFTVGGISGGAFNPAVALGASITGIFRWSDLWIYVVADLLGGASASLIFLSLRLGQDS